MGDRLILITVAVVVSILAWLFWHYLDDEAFNVMMLVFILVLVGDNYQLRKKIKTLTRQINSDS